MSQPNNLENYRYLLNMGEAEFDAMFGIHTMEPGPSADDVEDLDNNTDNNNQGQRKRRRRHTESQIQKLEDFFKRYPMPDDKQRKKISQETGLNLLQIKFWFQNRRTRVRAQHERSEVEFLKAENEKLRAENKRYKEAFDSTTCPNCHNLLALDERQYLKIENARLKGELDQFITGSSSVGAGCKKTNPTRSASIPPEKEGTNHHQADIDDDFLAMIDQFDVGGVSGL